MPGFKLDDYEPVEDRLAKFWADHPTGRVGTDLISFSEREYIVRAEVYRAAEDPSPAATGYAQETVGSSPVNKVSALENAETSAIGRALANAGYATKGKRPSREEMSKAQRGRKHSGRDWTGDAAKLSNPDALRALWKECADAHELTDAIREAITARVNALLDADAERAAVDAEAQAEDPWTSPADGAA